MLVLQGSIVLFYYKQNSKSQSLLSVLEDNGVILRMSKLAALFTNLILE